MSNQTILETLDKLRRAIAWFGAAGVSGSRRFAAYEATLETVAQRSSNLGSAGGADPELDVLFTALCESSDLSDISGLPADVTAAHRRKLIAIASGTTSYVDASIDDPARTTSFELVTASLFHRSGAHVSLENPSDVKAAVGDDEIFIECKRPTSIGALRRRIEEAYAQFRRHKDAGIAGFFVIALDITRLLNADFRVMSGPSRNDATLLLDVELARLLSDADSEVARGLRNARHRAPVDAVFFRVQCMTFEQDVSLWTLTTLWRIAPNHPPGSARFAEMQALFSPLPDMSPAPLDYPELQRLARAVPSQQP